MNISEYLNRKGEIQRKLLEFIDQQDDIELNFHNLISDLEEDKIHTNVGELKLFLHLINQISINHHREPNFFDKIFRILTYLKEYIKKSFTNKEIFNIFKNNKRTLLFLITEKIITIDENIFQMISHGKYSKMRYYDYFLPEMDSFLKNNPSFYQNLSFIDLFKKIQIEYDSDYEFIEEEKEEEAEEEEEEFIEENSELDLPENFEENRLKGENENYICQLIQKDLIEDFIIHVNKNSISLNSKIKPSIYETNSYLIKRNPTLIKYASFYGSIQIFKYLLLNKAELSHSLWYYAIHGNNPEIIHYLEENHIGTDYEICYKESVKCHHNDVADYIKENYSKDKDKFDTSKTLKYYNFSLIESKLINELLCFDLAMYDYMYLLDFLLKNKSFDINKYYV